LLLLNAKKVSYVRTRDGNGWLVLPDLFRGVGTRVSAEKILGGTPEKTRPKIHH